MAMYLAKIKSLLSKIQPFWERKVQWLSEHTSERNYQVIIAVIIGICAGLAAVVLKFMVVQLRILFYGSDPTLWNAWFIFLPIVGVLLSVGYVRYFLRKPIEFGAVPLIRAISRRQYRIPVYETYAHVISSSLTVGLGGSVGLEAPIMRTGAAIGSNIANYMNAGQRRQTLYIGCGVAAGMAAIFNSPVAGVIFAFEVFLSGTAIYSFIPLLVASVCGALVARVLYYEQLFYLPTTGWVASMVPYYVLLGVGCGLIATYMIRTIIRVEGFFGVYQKQRKKTLLGGIVLGVLIFLFPPLFGEGYETVNKLLSGQYTEIANHSIFYHYCSDMRVLLLYAVVIIFAKSIATAATLGMRGNGGTFAPAMFTGAIWGFVFAMSVNMTGIDHLPVEDFVAVGMGGVLCGMLKAPLTGIFLIAEITGGYLLFVPLMIVSAASYFVSYYFEPQSLYTRHLYLEGIWVPSHEKDKQVLKYMDLRQMIETNFSIVHPEDTLEVLVKTIAHCHRNLFPVIDDNKHLVGILTLDDVREIMFKPEYYNRYRVRDLMYDPPAILDIRSPMEKVMQVFERTQAWNLPVVDADHKYLGFVSKSSIFEKYRELLREVSEE